MTEDIFSRVDSPIPINELLQRVAGIYSLGDIVSSVPISTGYQDCNIDLTTSNGHYVVKIFSREKTKQRVHDVIHMYTASNKKNLPVPDALLTSAGDRVMEIPGEIHPIFISVFPFFSGKPMTRTPVLESDLRTLARIMAVIHTISGVKPQYDDTLGIKQLPQEYLHKKDALAADEQSLISPIVTKLSRIKLAALPQSVIHGTFEKENVLKNADGTLCLLDFGCTDFAASVLDIATFVANFTLYLDSDRRKAVIRTIMDAYQEIRSLTALERAALPTLIRAQYAAYAVGMTYHMRKDHDMTKQTQTWLDRGWDGLRTYAKTDRIVY